jgi:hypothetical protein
LAADFFVADFFLAFAARTGRAGATPSSGVAAGSATGAGFVVFLVRDFAVAMSQ